MELKVWVEGLERVVCGLTESTTCQETIYALAHATGKTGRFVLVEEWRAVERSLAPTEKPLELLRKWGEHGDEVRYVLKCLDHGPKPPTLRSNEALNSVTAEPSTAYSGPYLVGSRAAYSTGSLPRLRVPQRPPLLHPKPTAPQPANYHRVRVPMEPEKGNGSLSSEQSGLTISDASRSISSGSGTRRPPPPSYHEALSRIQTLKAAPPSPSLSTTTNGSIDSPSGAPGYQFPASRQQLLAMIQHHERQLRAQAQRMRLCDQKMEEVSVATDEGEDVEKLEAELDQTRASLGPLRTLNLPQELNFAKKAEEELRHQSQEVKSKTAEMESRLSATNDELRALQLQLDQESSEKENQSASEPSVDLSDISAEIAQVEASLKERQGVLESLIRSLGSGSLNNSRESATSKSLEATELSEEEPSNGKRPGVWV